MSGTNGTNNEVDNTSNEAVPTSNEARDTNSTARRVFDSNLREQWRAHVRANHVPATEHVSDRELDTIFTLHGVVACSWLYYRLAFYTFVHTLH